MGNEKLIFFVKKSAYLLDLKNQSKSCFLYSLGLLISTLIYFHDITTLVIYEYFKIYLFLLMLVYLDKLDYKI